MDVCLWPPRLTPSTSLHHQLSPLIYILSPPTNGISHKFPEVRQHTDTQTHRHTYGYKCVYCTCVCTRCYGGDASMLRMDCEGQSQDTNMSAQSKSTLPKQLGSDNKRAYWFLPSQQSHDIFQIRLLILPPTPPSIRDI